MRVGVVTTSYPRVPGDPAGAFVAGFARWLAERVEVEVIAAGPGARRLDGIPVVRVEGGGLFYQGGAPDALARRDLATWARALAFTSRLGWEVQRRSKTWDAVVSHWTLPSGLLVAMLAPRLPHLAVAHSSDVSLLQRSKLGPHALRALSRRADLVYAARHLVASGAPGRVVAMGIDVGALAAGDRTRGRRRWGLRGVTALFLGRLVPVKGVDLLLAALPPGMDLVVAGEGPLGESLRAQAGSLGAKVRFLGEIRGAAKADLLAAADLLVVPSRALADGRSEGTPTVLFEAMAAGLPIVATRTGGASTAISDGEDGLLVEADAEALRRGLARLCENQALRRRLGSRARRRAGEHDWSVVGPRLAGRLLDGSSS